MSKRRINKIFFAAVLSFIIAAPLLFSASVSAADSRNSIDFDSGLISGTNFASDTSRQISYSSDSNNYDYSSDSYDYSSDDIYTYDPSLSYNTNTYGISEEESDITKDGDVTIIDGENILYDVDAVKESMMPFTEYGKAVFISTSYGYYYPEDIEKVYDYYIGYKEDGMLLLIDMNTRRILLYTDGNVYSMINESYANTITDNIYTYASDGDYDRTVEKAFTLATRIMGGQKVAQPMRLITSILTALCIGFLISFIIISLTSSGKRSETEFSTAHISSQLVNQIFLRHTHEYVSSDSGGGSSGGGGGGGGGSSGGGGGHSF